MPWANNHVMVSLRSAFWNEEDLERKHVEHLEFSKQLWIWPENLLFSYRLLPVWTMDIGDSNSIIRNVDSNSA